MATMENTPNPFVRTAAHEMIVEKRDRLLAERALVMEQRLELLGRLRRMDRELADCKAAARLFDLDIQFPEEDEEREMRMRRDRELAMRAERQAAQRVEAANHARYILPARQIEGNASAHARIITPAPLPTPTPPPAMPPRTAKRPPLKDVILEQLRQRPAGAKAADLRDHIERTFGEEIHEKTVGMTLYRLSKESLVRRDGHIWFFGAVKAETENPGVSAPGSDNLLG